MFCTKCGKEIPENSTTCPSCNATLASSPKPINLPNGDTSNIVHKIKSLDPKILIGACAGVVVLLVAIFLFATAKPTINLNDYVSISCSGYNTVGYAETKIDYAKLEADILDKVAKEPTEVYSILSTFRENMAYSLDKYSNLSNGDQLTFTWNFNEEYLEKTFNCKIKYKDITVKVNSLKEIETFDPFEYVTVTFTGISPNGSASIEKKTTDSLSNELYFSIDENYNLKNGDTVTVTLYDSSSYLAETYGKVPSSTIKEYTVEGLETYVSKLEELSDSALTPMKSQAEDAYKAYAARSWSDGVTLNSMEYLGAHLLTAKNPDRYSTQNMITLVYKVSANINLADYSISENVTYYTCVTFSDITVTPDGTVNVDVTNYSLANDSFRHEVRYGEYSWDYYSYTFYGYKTLDEIYNDYVTSRIDTYSAQSSVSESKPQE